MVTCLVSQIKNPYWKVKARFVMQNFMPMFVLTGKDGFVTNNHSLHKW